MKKFACCSAVILLALTLLGSDPTAEAQVRGGAAGVRVGRGYGRGYGGGRWYVPGGYGYGGYGWGSGGSTVAEGYGQGMAEVIRAQGQYNQDNAEARLTNEEARTKYIENKKKAADTYWEMKDRHRQYKEEERQREEERAAKGRARLEQNSPSPQRPGLGPDDFDPVTGAIHWPEILQKPEFADSRKQLDSLFEHRSLTGGATGSKNSDAIEATTKAMREQLKKQISTIPAMDYIAAKKFLDGLAYEGQG